VNLYLDDDTISPVLVRLLRQAGHVVETSNEAGLSGEKDVVHLTHAVDTGRVLISKNYKDFELFADLLKAVQGHYPGIWVIRYDNDPSRDLKPAGVVRAIRNLVASRLPIPDCYYVLNHWR
jgi:hypothetical protein